MWRKESQNASSVHAQFSNLLIWDNRMMFQKPQSSAFWFWLFWGLCAGSQHAVNFLHFVEVFVPAKELKDMDRDIIYSLWGGSKCPWVSFIHKHIIIIIIFLLDLFLLFLCFITSQINFVLQNLRRPWKLMVFYKKEVGGMGRSVPSKFLENHAQCQVPLITNRDSQSDI